VHNTQGPVSIKTVASKKKKNQPKNPTAHNNKKLKTTEVLQSSVATDLRAMYLFMLMCCFGADVLFAVLLKRKITRDLTTLW
jgi:hypothetical protein